MTTSRTLSYAAIPVLLVAAACGKGRVGSKLLGGNKDHGISRSEDINVPGQPKFQLNLANYSSCSALQTDIHDLIAKRQAAVQTGPNWASGPARPAVLTSDAAASSVNSMVANAAVATSAAAAESDGSSNMTNVQEKGVDEADSYKVGDHHFFTAHDSAIDVVSRQNLTYAGALNVSPLTGLTIYSEGNQLIVIGSQPGATSTEVRFYDASAAGLPVLKAKRSFSGKSQDSRLTSGHLVLLFPGQLAMDPNAWWQTTGQADGIPSAPVLIDGDGKVQGVTCDRILQQQVRDFDFRMTKIVTLDVAKPDAPEQAAGILGGGDQIYMTPDHLYITKAGATWGYSDPSYPVSAVQAQLLTVTRVAVDGTTGAITPQAAGAVQGSVKDQWSFHELADGKALALMTSTTPQAAIGAPQAQNHLWILQYDGQSTELKLQSSLHGIGVGEDIKAVRYVDEIAYCVTFHNTDPLFAIDLHDAAQPKLLGQLDMPGFSSYLHPVSDHTMVGIGSGPNDNGAGWGMGLQVSLFDTTDKAHLKRIDNKVVGAQGASALVAADAHAFFFDKDSMLMGVPVVNMINSAAGMTFSGAIIYEIGSTLTEKARLSHSDLHGACNYRAPATGGGLAGLLQNYSATGFDISRIFKVDGHVVTMSRLGIKTYDPANFNSVQGTVRYPDVQGACPVFQTGGPVPVGAL